MSFSSVIVFFILICGISSVLIKGWRSPRFPSTDGKSDFDCGGSCLCGVQQGVCNIKCPGPVPSDLDFVSECDPVGQVIVQSSNYSCSTVLTQYSGGSLNGGRPLKVLGHFTTIGASIYDHQSCSTHRLGNETFRQTVEFELWPWIQNIEGYFDLTIYEKGNGTLDNLNVLGKADVFPQDISIETDDFFPEAYAVSIGVGKTNPKWTKYWFQGIDVKMGEQYPVFEIKNNPTTTSYEVYTETFMTAYDFSDFGVSPNQFVSTIRVRNLNPSDMVYGGVDGTSGWVAWDGEGCDTMECFEPQYISNGELRGYGPKSYDPDLFWISEITDSQRSTTALGTTGTSGTTGTTTGSTGTTGTTGTTGSTGTTGTSGTSGTTGTTGTTGTSGTTGTTGTSGTTGTTGTSVFTTGTTGTTGFYEGRAIITRVTPPYGSDVISQPDGVQVFGENFYKNQYFRCLFGGYIESNAILFEDNSVFCEVPSIDIKKHSSSKIPQSIQILNDNRNYGAVSNSLKFQFLLLPSPQLATITPNTNDRFCVSKVNCDEVIVRGHNLGDTDTRIECVWFDSYILPGKYIGTERVGSEIYDVVTCSQTAPYTKPMTKSVTKEYGFYLLIYRTVSGPLASNSLEWTYTCDPCDSE